MAWIYLSILVSSKRLEVDMSGGGREKKKKAAARPAAARRAKTRMHLLVVLSSMEAVRGLYSVHIRQLYRRHPMCSAGSSRLNEWYIETRGEKLLCTEFRRAWRERKALLVRKGVLCPNFDPDAIAGLALEADVPARLIRGTRKQIKGSPLAESELTELESTDWTILVNDAEVYMPTAADFADHVLSSRWAEAYAWLRDDVMLSLSAPEGGVGPHVDSNDVILIQCAGRRRWSLERGVISRSQEEDRLDTTKSTRCLSNFQADVSWDLDPGDFLFVPARIAHDGIALRHAENQLCITCSLGFRTEHSAQTLLEDFILTGALQEDPSELRLLSSVEASQSGVLPEEALLSLRSRLREALEDRLHDEASLMSFLGQLATAPRNPAVDRQDECWQHTLADYLGGTIVPYDPNDTNLLEPFLRLQNKQFILHHAPGTRLAISYLDENEALLAVDGRFSLQISPAVRPLAAALAQHRRLDTVQLHALLVSSGSTTDTLKEARDLLHRLLSSESLLLIRLDSPR